MLYDKKSNDSENWIITEDKFSKNHLGKCEAIMCQGNGYMGIRGATEEAYNGEVRNTFISGTFNRFDESEVTELPNAADFIQMDIEVNGHVLDLNTGILKAYSRDLNLRDGELKRTFTWISPAGDEINFCFRRMVSLKNHHIVAQKIEISCTNNTLDVKIQSGINGQKTNSGVQHFSEGEKRLFDGKYMHMLQTTTQSKIDFVINTVHNFSLNNSSYEPEALIQMDRRRIYCAYRCMASKNETLVIEKISSIDTSRDLENEGCSLRELKSKSLEALKHESAKGYDRLLEESAGEWQYQVWNKIPIEIDSENPFDQLAIRFAQYHLRIMTNINDNRMSVAAKGLSGEGYKGHTFWDTEIFVLPYFIFTDPAAARKLLEYRYITLKGARKKAQDNGYEGAMFPWESAWLEDGEVTPVWGAADIITGKATKIWSGFIEQHITSDIAYAVLQYYMVAKDEEFMELYGYEILFDIAKFWASRLEWSNEKQEYHINNVIGPDEYKEHVNNNAFTNYMAHWSIKKAIAYFDELKYKKPHILERLNRLLELDKTYDKWTDRIDKIYLPKPNEQLVIPQDDTYLQKKLIPLGKYKNQEQVGSMFKDYNLEQVNQIQVSKQADIMILFYLLEDLFEKEVKTANWRYYEPKTLHDSSLSLSTHSILASDLGDTDLAYDLFEKAANIDLGPNMKSSDHGIHAASIGGLWQCVVNGFGGVRMLNGKLRIAPHLPDAWSRLKFPITIMGDVVEVEITKNRIMLAKTTKENDFLEIFMNNQRYLLNNELCINY